MASKVMPAEEAVQLIESGDPLSVCGIIGGLVPERVLAARAENTS
jgi:acyl CoA:acetate/3-ketoacid CoA transferase